MSRPHDHITDGFADRVKDSRAARGLTQKDVSFDGCTAVYVCRIERGDRVPSLQVIHRLAAKLGVDPVWLARGEDEVSLTISRDAIPGIVGFISDGLADEYAKVVEKDPNSDGALSPVEWALLPGLRSYFSEEDQELIGEILGAVE